MPRLNMKCATSLALVSLPFFLGCGQETPTHEFPEISYELSTLPEEEVFAYAFHGGMSFTSIRYRLYGDRRLVREVVIGSPRRVLATREIRLSQEEIHALIQPTVGGLAELTPRKRTSVIGTSPLSTDAVYVELRLRLESYQRPGEEEIAPFEHDIWLDPMAARRFPQFKEAQDLVALNEMLEEFFGQTSFEAIRELHGDSAN